MAIIKSIVTFTNVAAGATQSQPHGISWNGVTPGWTPEQVTLQSPNFEVTACDTTNLTVRNNGPSTATCIALCESWHSFEQTFLESALNLTPHPFVIAAGDGGAGSSNALVGSITYGSGQDGAAVFDGVNVFSFASLVANVYTLSRDTFVSSGTLNAGITIKTAGFRLFCNGTFTIAATGVIHNDGNNAVAGAAGAGSSVGTLGIGTAGGNGRANLTGLPGTNQANTLGDASAAGGAGGAGGVNAGGAAGTYVPAATNGGGNYLFPMNSGFLASQSAGGNTAQLTIIGGGAGGGGGGSDNAGVTGGGGGGGGGVLLFHAYNLVNNGAIRAAGGNGAAASGAGGNGGGGGGGAGGIILQLSRYRSGSGTITAPGGTGGAAFGAGGVAGADGSAGHINAFKF